MVSPPSVPRQMPEKLTTAPISVRPFVSAAISAAMSKSACWMRMVTLAIISGPDSAAGHRREEGDLAGPGDRRIRLDMGVIDRGADHPRLLERIRISLAALRQPADQFVHGAHARRRL